MLKDAYRDSFLANVRQGEPLETLLEIQRLYEGVDLEAPRAVAMKTYCEALCEALGILQKEGDSDAKR
jgi:hypothetical protein